MKNISDSKNQPQNNKFWSLNDEKTISADR